MSDTATALKRLHDRAIATTLEAVTGGMAVRPTGILTLTSGGTVMFQWEDLTDTIGQARSENVASVTLVVDTYMRSVADLTEASDIDLETAFLAGDSQVVEAVVVQTVAGDDESGVYRVSMQPYGRVPDVHRLHGETSRALALSDMTWIDPFLAEVMHAMWPE